ncbi:MAG: 3-hydroxyacyl-CoA dehydrogenase NAD-binding domain-containing protein [Tahibacter sp.]
MSVTTQNSDGVAILRIDNPPINALGLATRGSLLEALRLALADTSVVAIVVTGGPRLFSGGADIREFSTPQVQQEPSLHTLIDAFEASTKPVVAAINGIALGGGLELVLGMHYRIASQGAQVGLPEVKIGLLPGAGGTQRLPRAAGLENAVEMILTGTPVSAASLSTTGLFDKLSSGDAVDSAIEFALAAASTVPVLPRVRDRAVKHPDAAGFFSAARVRVAASAGPYPAPLRCLEAIEAAVGLPFDDGMRNEREGFVALMDTPESKALRHAFFAERAASKIADIGADVPLRRLEKIGVVGAGTMGGGISMNFLNVAIPVTIVEANPEALQRGIATIRKNYEASAKKGRISIADVEQRMSLLSSSLSFDALADADLIIEAVFEDYPVKQAVFAELDRVAKPGAILATNTSTLDVDLIANYTKRPTDVLGTHFFSPANVMRLLEVVRGKATAKDVLASAMAMAKTIRKTAVVSGVCDGFIGNRMLEQYIRQAGFLLDEGALPEQVDRAIEAFGFAMGPFRMGDLAGNDIGWAIRQRRRVEKPDMVYSRTADLLCEIGRYGQKTQAGWYDYAPGDRNARRSALVEDLIVEHSRQIGLDRRDIGDAEIVERLLYALVNEGALILEEGIAAKASDIDIVYLSGYGFPAWRGGPMFHADTVGLPNVLAAIRRYAAGYQGNAWQPAPLLLRLAAAGSGFNHASPKAAAPIGKPIHTS